MNLKRILLVEDDLEDQYLFNHALDMLQMSVYCKAVCNGQEALFHLEHTPNYETIFLDLNMPVMNSMDCLKPIRANETYKGIALAYSYQ